MINDDRTDACPHCGQPLPRSGPSNSPETLKAVLSGHDPDGRPLQVYRIDGSHDWAVTRTRGRRFTREVVRRLVAEGWLSPVYPGTVGQDECYGPASYYGSPSYVREIEAKIAARSKKSRA